MILDLYALYSTSLSPICRFHFYVPLCSIIYPNTFMAMSNLKEYFVIYFLFAIFLDILKILLILLLYLLWRKVAPTISTKLEVVYEQMLF